jgi:hypothetical protein
MHIRPSARRSRPDAGSNNVLRAASQEAIDDDTDCAFGARLVWACRKSRF